MELVWQIIIGFTVAFILHELTHLFVIIYYKIPIKAIILTKWSGFGFLVDNDKYINDNLKLALLHFLPLIWCFVFFINPNEIFFLMFPIVNIFGGAGDIYFFTRLIVLPLEERLAWATKSEEKILKTIIWRKEISPKQIQYE
ncbi:MAG: hypothetical protein JSW60_09245 [Thermoplasmatales archaeon]|nr:MAG: hypothetical protein JSW60_09245 [Thermoplasmatales archaeon]